MSASSSAPMRDTLAGVSAAERASRVAVTTTISEVACACCVESATESAPAFATSGSSATKMRVMRMIGWPIIATNDYPCHGVEGQQESGKGSLVRCDFPDDRV